ncbi:MAG: WecB/TagA/CpsF family glycosyltransferase [Patescibacteria group bacterium]
MKVEILGVKIDKITNEEVLEKIQGYLDSDKSHFIVTPNPEFLVAAHHDKDFKGILNQADLAVPDGFGLKLAARYLGNPLKQRITGTDLTYQLAEICQKKHKSIYLLGALPGVAEQAAQKILELYPDIKIAGFESGYRTRFHFKLPDFILLAKINRVKPDVLLVAFGASKQEKWINNHLANMPSLKIAMGVGGAFDFISGNVKRSPKLMRSLGLEWFWRLIVQPWRLDRIRTATWRFSRLVIKSKKR